VRRALATLVVVLALAGALAPTALGHAVLITATPSAGAKLDAAPPAVVLTFSETVQLLKPQDLSVVDATGRSVASRPAARDPANAKVLRVPVKGPLAEGTYTVRYLVVSADSHVVGGAYAFGIGAGTVGEPYLGGATGSSGPSETGPWAVSARFLELIGLGGLLGLIAFRWLIWRPAFSRAGLEEEERTAGLAWGRDLFWVAFGVLAVGSMLAEGYLLVTKSASALGTSVWGALSDPGGISQVLGDTRFGSLVQLRGALLFGLFAIGIWQFLSEFGSERSPREASPSGRLVPSLLMAALILAVLGGISAQGHASTAPYPTLSIAADLTHLVSVAVWIAGLALVAIVLWRAPRTIEGGGGRALAGAVLTRFSRVALVLVSVAVVTGVLRAIAELDDPAQLWDTAYGRSIVYKILILCPIAFLAFQSRRVVTALRIKRVRQPNAPTIAMVDRNVWVELVLALAVVVVAALLVAQVPGRVT
jgi:copper transport protein